MAEPRSGFWRVLRVLERALLPRFIPRMSERRLKVKTCEGDRLLLMFDENCTEADYMRAVQWVEDERDG